MHRQPNPKLCTEGRQTTCSYTSSFNPKSKNLGTKCISLSLQTESASNVSPVNYWGKRMTCTGKTVTY